MPHPRSRLAMAALIVSMGAGSALAQPSQMAPPGPPMSLPIDPPSRAADILKMQMDSATTQPPSPPMTGEEATAVYQAYLARRGGGTEPGQSAKTAQAPAASSTTGAGTR